MADTCRGANSRDLVAGATLDSLLAKLIDSCSAGFRARSVSTESTSSGKSGPGGSSYAVTVRTGLGDTVYVVAVTVHISKMRFGS